MATSTDPGHFFQTTSSLRTSKATAKRATNTLGAPIHLPSKPLALILDPAHNGAVYVAESAGTVRRIVLETKSKDEVYRSPASTAPLTALSLHPPHSSVPTTIFAASWDKSIHSWSLATRAPGKRLVGGHTDFVKTLCPLLTTSGRSLLLSGGSDGVICLWDPETGSLLRKLRTGHTTGGILDLAFDPGCMVEELEDYGESGPRGRAQDGEEMRIFSAGSDRTIRRYRILQLQKEQWEIKELDADEPIVVHETSVNKLCVDGYPDLWTASADGMTKCLSPVESSGDGDEMGGWEVNTTLQHGDYVRAVVVDIEGGLVITAGRSESIKVWDTGTGECVGAYEGHFGEIMSLCVLEARREVVSVSVDCTVRSWSLKKEDIAAEKLRAEKARQEGGEGDEEEVEGKEGVGLTEEEERELEELMGDD